MFLVVSIEWYFTKKISILLLDFFRSRISFIHELFYAAFKCCLLFILLRLRFFFYYLIMGLADTILLLVVFDHVWLILLPDLFLLLNRLAKFGIRHRHNGSSHWLLCSRSWLVFEFILLYAGSILLWLLILLQLSVILIFVLVFTRWIASLTLFILLLNFIHFLYLLLLQMWNVLFVMHPMILGHFHLVQLSLHILKVLLPIADLNGLLV